VAGQTKKVDLVIKAACERLGVDPADVWDWRAYEHRVVVIAGDGRTLQVERERAA
jgi:hypothetical protein